MIEMVSIVDENNKVINVVPRPEMRKKQLPHRASYIVLQDPNGRYYIELRSKTKDYCPGMLDACIGGVVQAGENDIIQSGERELFEELGVKTNLKWLGWLKINTTSGSFLYAGLFHGIYQGALKLQVEEVDEVKMMTWQEIQENESKFTPDSIIALKEINNLILK